MIQPTTLFLGEKANKLLKMLAVENGLASRYFFTKLIIREARSEVAMLSADKMKERLALIEEVNDELVDLINNPPKELLADTDFSTRPKSIYCKIWQTHKRMEKNGATPEDIHDYCISRYGMDFDIKKTPTKNPKRNPDWRGGGRRIEVVDGE